MKLFLYAMLAEIPISKGNLVINTNARSLQYKMDDLKEKIRDKEAKIIAVTET